MLCMKHCWPGAEYHPPSATQTFTGLIAPLGSFNSIGEARGSLPVQPMSGLYTEVGKAIGMLPQSKDPSGTASQVSGLGCWGRGG